MIETEQLGLPCFLFLLHRPRRSRIRRRPELLRPRQHLKKSASLNFLQTVINY
jgi:hypothetical protein